MPFVSRTLFGLIAFSLVLTGCSSSGENDTAIAASQITRIDGQAVKGLIQNGVVSVYSVSSDENPLQLIDTTTTDDQGRFSLELSTLVLREPVLLQVTGDAENAAMVCDDVAGCIEPDSGEWHSFGDAVLLSSDFQLLGLVQREVADRNQAIFHANVSALSHLVVATALNLPDGLTHENIQQASGWVNETLDLQGHPLATPLIDITDPSTLDTSAAQTTINSALNAGLYSLSASADWLDASITINDIQPASIYQKTASILQTLGLDNNSEHPASAAAQTIFAHSELATESGIQILSKPRSTNTSEGDSFYFRVHAAADSALSYQWLHNGVEIPEANSAVYGQADSTLADAGSYQVLISTNDETISSRIVTLRVNEKSMINSLEIQSQPQSQALVSGQELKLSVTTNRDPNVEVQWQHNGSLLSNEHGASLEVGAVTVADSGMYRAVVSANGRVVYSDFANVHVTDALNEIQIVQQPQSATVLTAQNARFGVRAHGGGYLRYQWFKDGRALANRTQNQLEINAVSFADQGDYYVEISNSLGKVKSSRAALQVISHNSGLTLMEQPRSADVYLSEDYTLSVKAASPTSHNYQWFKDGIAIANARSSSYRISDADNSDAGQYYVVVTNALGEARSSTATIRVRERPSLALSWGIPYERENGVALQSDEIFGYQLGYGYSLSAMTQSMIIEGATNTQHTLSNLESGSIFLHIATIDSDGVTGRFSDPIEVYLP